MRSIIEDVENHYQNIAIDIFCVMPDHVHLIVAISETRVIGAEPGAIHESPQHDEWTPHTRTQLSKVVGFIKMNASKQIRLANNTYIDVWQRGYYDRIIRHSDEYNKIQEYISTNPLRWQIATRDYEERTH